MVTFRSLTAALAIGLFATAASASSGSLQARLAHDVVREGERVELVLRASADGPVSTPDLSPLEKDFEILGTRQSQQVSIVNGHYEGSVDWIVTLEPRRTGDLVVPAIRAGNAESEPLELRVSDAGPPPSRRDAPDLFVESSVDESAPYVQGEVRYTVKVYSGIDLLEGALSEPRVENARVTPIGEGRTYEESVNGRRYNVHEREYSISPQTSGPMKIEPVVLQARIDDPDARGRSPFDDEFFDEFFGGNPFAAMGRGGFGAGMIDRMMNMGREVRVRSNPVSLDVQARPDGVDGGWFLPAREVELAESFDPAQPSFRVGDAVKRIVSLSALGAASEQLPRFDIPAPDGVKQYDEGSRQGTVPSDAGVVSVLEQTVALVPTKPGSVTLPPIEVKWWDVASKTARTASLPAKTIDVLPAAGDTMAQAEPAPAPAAKPASASKSAPAAAAKPEPKLATEPGAVASTPEVTPTSPWMSSWYPIGVAALAFVLGIGGSWLVFSRRRGSNGGEPSGTAAPRARDLASGLQEACKADDARAARDALVGWARATWGSAAPVGCAGIARRLDHPGFTAAVATLERSLYSPTGADFRGQDLWQEFRAATRRTTKTDDRMTTSVLPELYPSSSNA